MSGGSVGVINVGVGISVGVVDGISGVGVGVVGGGGGGGVGVRCPSICSINPHISDHFFPIQSIPEILIKLSEQCLRMS